MKIFIWGTGQAMEKILIVLSPQTEVLGFIDNNSKQQYIRGKKIYTPDIINHEKFDYIIIGAYTRYKEISDQIESMGIDKKKIIQFYNYTRFFPRTFFYNESVVNDIRYNQLFNNFMDIRIGYGN